MSSVTGIIKSRLLGFLKGSFYVCLFVCLRVCFTIYGHLGEFLYANEYGPAKAEQIRRSGIYLTTVYCVQLCVRMRMGDKCVSFLVLAVRTCSMHALINKPHGHESSVFTASKVQVGCEAF